MTEAALDSSGIAGEALEGVGAPKARRRRVDLRRILLVFVPLAALVVGVGLYLAGGRFVATDDAYVGMRKVLITPDVSGKVIRVGVKEGQRVEIGDVLFEIDPVPFDNALRQAQGKLDGVRVDFANLRSNYAALSRMLDLGRKNIDIRRRELERRVALAANKAGSQSDLDGARTTLLTAELQVELVQQQLGALSNQLRGDPNLPIEAFHAYRQAEATLAQARHDLDHAVIRAPIAGVATQVDNIQLGRFVTAGAPVLSLFDHESPWIDANPKETEVARLRAGQKVEISIDSFPDRSFHGLVESIGPGTAAQFSILPPQNASGNWVKVVQRVPVRVVFEPGENVAELRAGMSSTISVDTGRSRMGSLFETSRSHAAESPK